MSVAVVPQTSSDRFVPYLISRLFFVAAALLVLQTLFRGTAWLTRLGDLFSMLVFPVDTGSLGLAALLVILGVGLTRRKRLAWWISLIYLGAQWLVALGLFIVLMVELARGEPTDPSTDLALGQYLFNGFSIGVLLVLLIVRRRDFMARTAPGNTRRALLVLAVGLLLSLGVSWVLVWVAGGQGPPRSRLYSLLRRLVDSSALERESPSPGWVSALMGLMIAISVFAALNALMRSQRQQSLMSLSDEVAVRQLLAQNPADSLGYFATRRDKAVLFSPKHDAAVAYRAELGVSLAAGDPLGPVERWPGAIQAWLNHSHSYGWSPAVVGASEDAARMYADFGMRLIRVGDEAILRPADFDLDGRDLRPVRQVVRRLERLGYTVRIRRHRDIDPTEMARIMARADHWRQGGDERGFSMALGRLGDPLDANCVLVEALHPADGDQAGRPAALLSLVPWGSDGLSLDLMRRDPYADNGVTELMVSALMSQGRDLGLKRVSLNFAVFRSTFEEGAQLGAGFAKRIKRRLLLVASRWFQIEQLYRSNVKYSPSWQPRFLCLLEPAEIGSVGLAIGVAEGFIDLPRWLVPLPPSEQPLISLDAHPELAALAAPPEPVAPQRPITEQMRHRSDTRAALLAAGEQPYPAAFRRDAQCADVRSGRTDARLTVAGRVRGLRDHGGVLFITVQDWSGSAQVILERDRLGAESLGRAVKLLSLGDHVGFTGVVGRSATGTASLLASSWTLTAKALRPLPDKHKGMNDPEAKVRQRYLDLIMNADARHQLRARSLALKAVRDTLQARGFLEVETPILQTVHGGANARPFRTHINAYDLDLYLRIAPELFLKRLMVGGVDRVFEIGRNFRNEGADATHNPEFTMLEAYEAYGDYVTMREVARTIVVNAAQAALGGTVITGTDWQGTEHQVDLAEPWTVITVNDALSAATGQPISADTTRDELEAIADGLGINVAPQWGRGDVLLELYEHLVEHRTVAPTFYCDFPAEVSPLTREHRDDPRLAERWDLVAFGAEIGTAYSELVDPVVQRERLTAQSLLAARGDVEAMELDEAFLTALEYAMPPSGGLGMGMDRLVMMLTQSSIRETIAFPLVRPQP